MNITFPVKSVSIINYGTRDLITLKCDGLPNPYPKKSTPQTLSVRLECQATFGIQYLDEISHGTLKPNNLYRAYGKLINWNDDDPDTSFDEIKKEWENNK